MRLKPGFVHRSRRAGNRAERAVGRRRHNPRRAKVHRNYTVEEAARLFGVHRNTVRQWIKQGLPVCNDRKPKLILGGELVDFIARKRISNKRPCGPGKVYCVRCRAPQAPALDMVDFVPLTATAGNLVGLCPQCGGVMYRRVALARLGEAKGNLEVKFAQALEHIAESVDPSVNSDFKAGE